MKYITIVREDEESKKIEKIIRKSITIDYSENNPDYVVAVGGDGTIIKASHTYPNAVIFGVHTGHLGFYANYSVDTINELIDDINNNSFSTQNIDLIICEKINGKEVSVLGKALNEITILDPLKTLTLDVYLDNDYFETFKGTGLCISTPFGSTAYNKALNGAVVDTSISTIQLTEIASINSNAYRTLASPLVLSSNRTIELKNGDGTNGIYITMDQMSMVIESFSLIKIRLSDDKVKMAYHRYEDHLKRIKRSFLK